MRLLLSTRMLPKSLTPEGRCTPEHACREVPRACRPSFRSTRWRRRLGRPSTAFASSSGGGSGSLLLPPLLVCMQRQQRLGS